ncbi:hypothetical protein Clacol_006643 [Clathrus columnatus]|uniref:Transglutaminase-like domain-containing protein n=1 Tax=Clathrus columnatus TaxID=1419009 RepID=A0AAV5AHF9_9AGAM|nr:hypothetical protein Clacol_006643 [Clathrus columnatus]
MNIDVEELAQNITAQWIERCLRRGRRPREPSPVELATVAVLVTAIRAGPSGSSTTATRHDAQLLTGHQLRLIIERIDKQIDWYEDPKSLATLEHIPLQELYEKAETIQSSNEPLPCFEDALAECLVRWFRDDFFVWIDRKTEKCPVCHTTPLKLVSTPSPTDEERQGGAGRVELDLSVLMRTRVGRCGEFANLFTLFLRAVGLRAQYIWNKEDHVWNAYWSPAQERWIHVDSCEATRDQPLLYSKGWNKFMTYCLAFSCDGAMDVSKGYIQGEKWAEATSRRSMISESDLSKVLKAITARRRMGRSNETIRILEEEDAKMERWLNASDSLRGGESSLEARKSGNDDWKQSRGEAAVRVRSRYFSNLDGAKNSPVCMYTHPEGKEWLPLRTDTSASANHTESHIRHASTPALRVKIVTPLISIIQDISRHQCELSRTEQNLKCNREKLKKFEELTESLRSSMALTIGVAPVLESIRKERYSLEVKIEQDIRRLTEAWEEALNLFIRAIYQQFDKEIEVSRESLRQEARVLFNSFMHNGQTSISSSEANYSLKYPPETFRKHHRIDSDADDTLDSSDFANTVSRMQEQLDRQSEKIEFLLHQNKLLNTNFA